MAVANHAIFKMVSLRSPRQLSQDVTEDVPKTPLFTELDKQNPDPENPDPKLADIINRHPPIHDADAKASLLFNIADALDGMDKCSIDSLSKLTIDRGNDVKVKLHTLVSEKPYSDELEESMAMLSDSWLGIRLGTTINMKKGAAGENEAIDLNNAANIRLIEQLLRVGWIAKRFVEEPNKLHRPGTCDELKKIHLVYPRHWRKEKYLRRQVEQTHREVMEQRTKERKNFKPQLHTKREEREKIIQEINNIERIHDKSEAIFTKFYSENQKEHDKNIKIEPTRTEGIIGRVIKYIFGSSFKENTPQQPENFEAPEVNERFAVKLKEVLTESEKITFKEIWSAMGDIESISFDEYGGQLNELRHSKLEKANNDLCSMKIWEEEITRPDSSRTPLQVNDDNRPSVRSIGVGDLIVARETLIGYKADEIAHIENVLPGEERVREHERTTSREEVRETEEIEEKRSERDVQTTDRFELQNQSQKTISQDFSVKAGVDTSGTYGLTTINTSLDSDYSLSIEESTNSSSNVAKEIVSKAAQYSRESIRELRRVTLYEQIRELNRHTIDRRENQKEAYSGVYYWIERIHEIQLRHYGMRLMVEFNIPEPGLSLLPSTVKESLPFKKPAPLTIGPEEIKEDNYMCLAGLYGATDVEPPPPRAIQVGYSWASTPDPEKEGAESMDCHYGSIEIPVGYKPHWALARFTSFKSSDDVHIYIGLGNQTFYHVFSHGTGSAGSPLASAPAPNGLPVTIRMANHCYKTGAVHIWIDCRRNDPSVINKWRLKVFERIKEAHQILVSEYERKVAQAKVRSGVEITGRAPSENRAREIVELKKWAIKSMRLGTFDFDAVVNDLGEREIDPIAADLQAPIVRFFEEALEWRQMSYFLYPYYWGSRDENGSFNYRRQLQDPDPLHQQFLRAGAARVIVSVTPGYEERILYYLGRPSEGEMERVRWVPPKQEGDDSEPPVSEAEDAWIEVLMNKNHDVQLGTGTLDLQKNSDVVTINEDSEWRPDARDLGRELYINADLYIIVEVIPVGGDGIRRIRLDRKYPLESVSSARYGTGSVPIGEPWTVTLPTSLLILGDQRSKLKMNIQREEYGVVDKLPS